MRGGSIAASIVIVLAGGCGTLIVDSDAPDAGSPVGSDGSSDTSSSSPDGTPGPTGDGSLLPDGEARPCGHAGEEWLVFVTSATFAGAPSGLASEKGAEIFDTQCTTIAHDAGFGGAFKAYVVSPPGSSAPKRIGDSPNGWARPDGKVVFTTAGIKGEPASPINVTEKCTTVTDGAGAWTGVAPDSSVGQDCSEWYSLSVDGYYGDPAATDSTWQTKALGHCSDQRHLYCFQTSN